MTPCRIGRVLYHLAIALFVAAAVILVLCAWGALPWFGLGGKLFLTAWLGGVIIGILGATYV